MNKTTKLIIALFALQTMIFVIAYRQSEIRHQNALKEAYKMYIEDRHELTNQVDCVDVRFSNFKVEYDAIHESRLTKEHRGF